MNDPILVEVTRGPLVESRHVGALAISDGQGKLLLSLGDVERGVFPRSAVKGLQALPLVESGAADRYKLTDAEIALACASHRGEDAHVETARGMLAKAGRDEPCLECGAHWPGEEVGRALSARGAKPTQLHNNCSGKHSGFVCTACHEGEDPRGYVKPEHPVQRRIRAAMSEIAGVALDERVMGVDGCSIPSYATPLSALARAFARFGSGETLDATRAAAAKRIRKAVAAQPFMVRGTGGFDTVVMEALRERAFTKTGAEGVYCAALPETGLGVALKCADGAGRASEIVMASVIASLLKLNDSERAVVDRARAPALKNWNGIHVGDMKPSAELMRVLEPLEQR
ncbi:asparaginase [Terrarubrum flagellatum]|uniref:asparaginase n=1 Tax=Terrirubrum flagellatum TaxID=2895980 RepID=UPI0031455B04